MRWTTTPPPAKFLPSRRPNDRQKTAMKHAFQPLVLSLLLGAAGCASSGGPGLGYQNINAFTTLYLDIQEARVARPSLADIAGRRTPQLTIPPRNIFSIRDLVAAAVQNYSYQDQLVL